MIPPVGETVYWTTELYDWRAVVKAHRAGKTQGVTLLVLTDARTRRRGGRNWMRERMIARHEMNARHVSMTHPSMRDARAEPCAICRGRGVHHETLGDDPDEPSEVYCRCAAGVALQAREAGPSSRKAGEP